MQSITNFIAVAMALATVSYAAPTQGSDLFARACSVLGSDCEEGSANCCSGSSCLPNGDKFGFSCIGSNNGYNSPTPNNDGYTKVDQYLSATMLVEIIFHWIA
ncbi:hypothetical protein DM02DRAFT_692973 [Periconia macrospinosa]|uniref:Uncharacterized protein n=1 Tax=Periconia macrospinosa TaxID=97972 RepID=A0A2V1DBG0_9PLEO|nr:hypothetical protein DM02DRAFT_692973 [Periconia macrospinosa]